MFFCVFFLILSINHFISQSRQARQPGPDAEWQASGGQVFPLPQNAALGGSGACDLGGPVRRAAVSGRREAPRGEVRGGLRRAPAWVPASETQPDGDSEGRRWEELRTKSAPFLRSPAVQKP